MKRKSLYIVLFIISLFAFSGNFKAADNVEVTCKYKNPYGGSDIVLIGTNYENDYLSNYTGKSGTGDNRIKADGSSFSQIIFYEKVRIRGEYALQPINLSNTMSFSGRNWLFAEGTSQIIEFLGDDVSKDSEYKCKELYYYEKSVASSPGTNVTVLYGNASECDGEICKQLELLTKDVQNVKPSTREKVSTCTYKTSGIKDINKNDANFSIVFTSYSDGTLYFNLDGSSRLVDFSKAYPINTTHKVNGYSRIFMFTKEQINSMVRMDSQNKLTCYSNSIGCFGTGGIYYTFNSLEELKNSGVCVASAGNAIIDEDNSNGAEIVDNESNIFNGGNISSSSGVCVDYLGSVSTEGSVAQLLDKIYTLIKIVSILIVILWSMLDLSKAIIKDKDELMPTVKKCIIRIIILLIILLLPSFIDMIGNLVGLKDILCGIK